jgi:hypothetical protein
VTFDAVTATQCEIRKKVKEMLFFAEDGSIRCLPCSNDVEKKFGKVSVFTSHHSAHLHVSRHLEIPVCDACWTKFGNWTSLNIHKGHSHPNFVFDRNYFFGN